MKKFIAVALVVFMLLALAACTKEIDCVGETKTYEIASEIHSLEIEIGAADFVIEQGEAFSVESNLKYLTVSERNGVLTIVEKVKNKWSINVVDYTDAMLKLYVPKDMVFETVDITTGAAKLTADSLSANRVELELGAGKAEFGCLNAYERADIEGGAGQITIASGTLHNLELDVGVGELNLTAALTGNSDLCFGVGKSVVTLMGNKETYKLDVEKGAGVITVDGETVISSYNIGNGENYVEIEGGIGTVDIAFMAE